MPNTFGKYEIIEALGQGGMGTVYKARDPVLDRVVALKVLNPDVASPENYERFRREVRVLTKLRHPNIVRLLTAGVEQDRVYFTMDYIEGQSLTDLIAGVRTARGREALIRVVATATRAVHHAHEQGIIHRDLKPSNIIIDTSGNPIITDFGLARELEAGHTITAPGAAVGTALYMSPEQAEGDASQIGPATDIYALGCILYETLTGRPPFEGETAAAILGNKAHQRPPSLRKVDRSIPRDLETISLTCLAKSANARYPTAEGLAIDLERFLAGHSIFASRSHGRAIRDSLLAHPWKLVLAATFVLAGVGLLVAVVRRNIVIRPAVLEGPPSPEGSALDGSLGVSPSDAPPRKTDVISRSTASQQQASQEAEKRKMEALADLVQRRLRAPDLETAVITNYYSPRRASCIVASANAVWWGTRGGAYRLETKTNAVTFFPTATPVLWIGCGPGPITWIAAREEVYRSDGRTFQRYPAPEELGRSGLVWGVKAGTVDARGRLWLAAETRRCLYGFDGVHWKKTPDIDGLAIKTLACDSQGRVWVADFHAVHCYSDGAWRKYAKEQGLPTDFLKTVVVDSGDVKWIGATDGLCSYDGIKWTLHALKRGEPLKGVKIIRFDNAGTMWCNTLHGIARLKDEHWQVWDAYHDRGLPRSPPDAITLSASGAVWYFAYCGVGRFDGRSWKQWEFGPKFPYPLRGGREVAVSTDGRAWWATPQGVYSFDGTKWKQHTLSGLPSDSIHVIAVDGNGVKWFSTDKGFASFDGGKWVNYEESEGKRLFPSLKNAHHGARVARDADGCVWRLSGDSTLVAEGRTTREYPIVLVNGTVPRVRGGIAVDSVGTVWVGGWTGLLQFSGAKWTLFTPDRHTAGPYGVAVGAIAVDGAGRVWAGTHRNGLYCYDGKAWHHWTVKDRLADDSVKAICVETDHSMWVGTDRGYPFSVSR